MPSIKIPNTIEEATESLTGIESLLTVQRWERAAIVAAFVRLGQSGDNRFAVGVNNDPYESPKSFAALGIAGLTSKNTVQTYVLRWLDTHDGIYPEPGAKVIIPKAEWEPTGSAGSTNTPAKVKAQIAADPARLAELLTQAAETLSPEDFEAAIEMPPRVQDILVADPVKEGWRRMRTAIKSMVGALSDEVCVEAIDDSMRAELFDLSERIREVAGITAPDTIEAVL
jgi:hypothetical protein